jgi:hypothetical protein
MPGGGNLSVTRNQIFNVLFALKNMKDQQFKKTLQTAFSNLDKFMIWSNTIKRYQLPPEKPEPAAGGIAPGGKEMTQVNLPLKERSNQKKNSKDIDTPQSTAIQRYLTKVRRAAPNATSDIEAVARHDLEQQTRTDKTINDSLDHTRSLGTCVAAFRLHHLPRLDLTKANRCCHDVNRNSYSLEALIPRM